MSFLSGISLEYIIYALLAIIVTLLFFCVLSIRNTIKLHKIMKNCSSGKIDETIVSYYSKIENMSNDFNAKANEIENLKNMINAGVQKIGFVRYDAFGDVSSNLSFSLVLLDGSDNGFVISSIYGRDTSNAYIKPINNGASEYALSAEETAALQNAADSYKNKIKRGK